MTAVVDREQGAAVGAERHLEDMNPGASGAARSAWRKRRPRDAPSRPRIPLRRPCRRARTRARPRRCSGWVDRRRGRPGPVAASQSRAALVSDYPAADGQEEPAVRAEGEPADSLRHGAAARRWLGPCETSMSRAVVSIEPTASRLPSRLKASR